MGLENIEVNLMREIGGKIRALRKEQRRTLHDLAEAVGTSVSMISQVERGSAQPSIATLWKLADALGVPVVHFFSEPEKPKAMVVRARQQRMLEMTNPAAAYSLLSPDMHRKIEFLKIVLQPGCIDDSELVSHLGEECGYVVSGTLTVRIAAESYVLEPGDAIYFESSMPHRLLNMHTEACVSVWAMTPPTF